MLNAAGRPTQKKQTHIKSTSRKCDCGGTATDDKTRPHCFDGQPSHVIISEMLAKFAWSYRLAKVAVLKSRLGHRTVLGTEEADSLAQRRHG